MSIQHSKPPSSPRAWPCAHLSPVGDWCRHAANTKCPIVTGNPCLEHLEFENAPQSKLEIEPKAAAQPFPESFEALKRARTQACKPSRAQLETRTFNQQLQANLEHQQWPERLKASLEPHVLFEQITEELEVTTEAARALAEKHVDALLDTGWQLLLGKTTKLIRFLLVENLMARAMFHFEAEYVFATYAALGRQLGCSSKTIERRLSPRAKNHAWVKCWIGWHPQVITRPDGLPCVAGTIFRIDSSVKNYNHAIPVPQPSNAAFQTAWRGVETLPQQVLALQKDDQLPVVSNNRQKNNVITTFPKNMECFGIRGTLVVEGRDMRLSTALLSNNRQNAINFDWKGKLSNSSTYHARALEQAEAISSRLGDQKSTPFWYTVFRKALIDGSSTVPVFAAVSQALEARKVGMITRSSVGGYAVGILQRSGYLSPKNPATLMLEPQKGVLEMTDLRVVTG